MIIKRLNIKGLRGFEETGTLNLAIPNGKEGSGLTILVGPNNSGKTTIIEAFHAISVGINPIVKNQTLYTYLQN